MLVVWSLTDSNYLQSPHIFVCAELLATGDKQEKTPLDALGGTTVSSLHRLKDIDNSGKFH